MGWVLAIDFGTVVTAAAVVDAGPADRVRPVAVEVDGSWRVPSAVLRLADGQLVVGRMAQNQAALRIEAFEATPKRRMGQPEMDLGGPVRVVDAIAAALSVMFTEACRVRSGSRPDAVCLTHPATWAATRLSALREAAASAGLPEVILLPEPVAAACWYAATSGQVPAGGRVAVYDLGGGTFDAAVVESGGDGSFTPVGRPLGVDPLGGVDFDHALLALVGETIHRRDPELWASLQRPADTPSRRRRRAMLEQVRLLKEDLSTISQSALLVPETELEVTITREQFAALIRPAVEHSAQVLLDTIADAQMTPDQLAAVYLVGGSSRIPVVEQIIADRLGRSPATLDEPKQVVAFGAALDTARRIPVRQVERRPAPPPGADSWPTPPPPSRPEPDPVPVLPWPQPQPGEWSQPPVKAAARQWWQRPASIVAAIVVALAAVSAVVLVSQNRGTPSASSSSPGGASSSSPGGDGGTTPGGGSSATLSTDEQALVDQLPVSLVDTTGCVPESTSEDSYTIAAVNCPPGAAVSSPASPGVAPTSIHALRDRSTDLFQQDLDSAYSSIATSSTDCSVPPATNTWAFGGGAQQGRTYCFVTNDSTRSLYVWTYSSDLVVLSAWGGPSDVAGLDAWWHTLTAADVTLR